VMVMGKFSVYGDYMGFKGVRVFVVEGGKDRSSLEECVNDGYVDWVDMGIEEVKRIGVEVGVWVEREDGNVDECEGVEEDKWGLFWERVFKED